MHVQGTAPQEWWSIFHGRKYCVTRPAPGSDSTKGELSLPGRLFKQATCCRAVLG